jgi:NADPH:quinone reductase
MKAIRVHQHGGPDALSYDDVAEPVPAFDQALIRVTAAGVNFIDTYHRSGLYPQPLPFIPGQEGTGLVVKAGVNALGVKPGDRVAWAQTMGSYAEEIAVAASRLVRVPDDVPDDVAAAVLLQGLTAHYLATSTFPIGEQHTCLVHAAAGGVGLLLTQIAKLRGASVIGTVSTEAKAQLARGAGADHVIRYDQADVAEEVRKIVPGGVDVVYDGVGKNTWEVSLASLRPRGMMVSFGNASGAVGAIPPLELSKRGSLFLTRPTLAHYIADRAEYEARARDLFRWIGEGRLHVRVDRKVSLEHAADAHRALESRQTAGKVLLLP